MRGYSSFVAGYREAAKNKEPISDSGYWNIVKYCSLVVILITAFNLLMTENLLLVLIFLGVIVCAYCEMSRNA